MAGKLDIMSGTFCETMLGTIPAFNLIAHANPSMYARMLLNDSSVVARTSHDHLFIWKCQLVHVKPRNGDCYLLPRILYTGTGGIQYNAFIESDGRVVSMSHKTKRTQHYMPYSLGSTAWIEIGSDTHKLDVTVTAHNCKDLLAPLSPNFTNIIFKSHTTELEIDDIAAV